MLKDHKDTWADERREREYLASMTEGYDYSGLRLRYRTDWVCRHCGLIVKAGRGHGHGRLQSR